MKDQQRPLSSPVQTAASVIKLGGMALLLAAFIGGCSSFAIDLDITDRVRVERVDSANARVTTVRVRDHDGQLTVSGRLKKRRGDRGWIPGHLHIDVLDHGGAVLARMTADYYRLSAKQSTSAFRKPLDVSTDQVVIVRVTHHQPHEA